MSAADLQRIQVKVLLERPEGFVPEPFIQILDSWHTPDSTEWIDFADYAHLKDGPVVALIGVDRNVMIDITDGLLGVLVRWRRRLEGSDEERFLRVARDAVAATTRALADPRCPPGLTRAVPSLEIGMNDRLDFPDDDETEARLGGPIRAALDTLLGAGGYSLERLHGPARRYVYRATATSPR